MINVQAFIVNILWGGRLSPLENGASSEGTQFLWKKRNGSFRGDCFFRSWCRFPVGSVCFSKRCSQ